MFKFTGVFNDQSFTCVVTQEKGESPTAISAKVLIGDVRLKNVAAGENVKVATEVFGTLDFSTKYKMLANGDIQIVDNFLITADGRPLSDRDMRSMRHFNMALAVFIRTVRMRALQRLFPNASNEELHRKTEEIDAYNDTR